MYKQDKKASDNYTNLDVSALNLTRNSRVTK